MPLYLRATTPPQGVVLDAWQRHRDSFIGPSSRQVHAWIRQDADPDTLLPASDRLLTFEDLIRLRMIALLRAHGISRDSIMLAEKIARQLTGAPQPFVTEPLWTYSSDVFLRLHDQLVASKRGQLAMPFLAAFLRPADHGLSFDRERRAVSWRPAADVLIAPDILFGAPCIEGTRISTESIWAVQRAGESVSALATMYDVQESCVESALAWEATLARAA